jgi:hypothetical protein
MDQKKNLKREQRNPNRQQPYIYSVKLKNLLFILINVYEKWGQGVENTHLFRGGMNRTPYKIPDLVTD